MSYIWVQSARIWICLQDQDIPTSWGTAELFIQQSCEVHMHCKLGNVFPALVLFSAVTVDCISTKNCRQLQFFFQVEVISSWEVSIHVNNLLLKCSSPCWHSVVWKCGSAVLWEGILLAFNSHRLNITVLPFHSEVPGRTVLLICWQWGFERIVGPVRSWIREKKRKLLFSNFPCFKSVIEPSKF